MQKRREQITEAVNREGLLTLPQLRALFPHVSDVTLRKDLKWLDEEKHIIRIHGGAKSIPAALGTPDTHLMRLQTNLHDKEIIAEKAATILQDYSTVYIAPGSTCYVLAKRLRDMPMQVYTDGLLVANELMRCRRVETTLIGGTVDPLGARTMGPSVFEALSRMRFDCAVVGVDGFQCDLGFTHYLEHTNAVCRSLRRRVGRLVVVMDHSKLSQTRPSLILPTEDVDTVITDRELPDEVRLCFERAGVEIL